MGKAKYGLFNKIWHNPGHSTAKECLCCPDTELLAMNWPMLSSEDDNLYHTACDVIISVETNHMK